jgi:hypothetical protein
MSKSFRSSASFGKRQEYVAIAELLKRGYDVYLTLVDDQGIDCVVRQGPNHYFDIQIKARSKDANPKNAGHFPQLLIEEPRDSYIFIFYSEAAGQGGTHWVIPSTKFAEKGFCNTLKSGPNKGRYRILLTNYSQTRGVVTPRPKYQDFINAFEDYLGPPPLV